MTKEVKEQSLREWMNSQLRIGEISGFSPNEISVRIIAEYSRRLGATALTNIQIAKVIQTSLGTEAEDLKDFEWMATTQDKAVATAQLKASLEAVNGK